MSKFKIKLKLTGFEMEIEGSRDDMPSIQQAISQQLGGLLQPPAGIIDDASESQIHTIKDINPEAIKNSTPKKRKRAPATAINGTTANPEDSKPVAWPRDAHKYGTPSQSWKTAQKILWTLYVAQEGAGESELSGKRLHETFNKHYRQSKPLIAKNLNRDLGALKMRSPSLVQEDATKTPSAWYLTEEGVKEVQKNIAASQATK